MADLTDVVQWEPGIYQLEESDPVQAGPGEIDNRQAQELANRTAYLKGEIESNDTEIATNTSNIATNTAGLAQEITDRGAADTNLQNQIDAINPFNEEIYSSSGAAVGQHNLSSGKTFSTYDQIIVMLKDGSDHFPMTLTVDYFESGVSFRHAMPKNGFPNSDFRWVDDDTFEVTTNTADGIVSIEGVKN